VRHGIGDTLVILDKDDKLSFTIIKNIKAPKIWYSHKNTFIDPMSWMPEEGERMPPNTSALYDVSEASFALENHILSILCFIPLVLIALFFVFKIFLFLKKLAILKARLLMANIRIKVLITRFMIYFL